jgi:integrase
MAKSNVKSRKNKIQKPAKPYKDFPLFPHASGRWCKKIRVKQHYFGKWDDPDAALQKYLDQKDDLHSGRTPRKTGDRLTIADLCNRFLNAKRHLLDTSEITVRSFRDYFSTCERIVDILGRNRLIDDLAADDFESFRSTLSKGRGPVALGNEIGRVRMVFKYGYDQALIDKPIRFGKGFNRPSKKVLRKARAENGKRMFESDELRKIIDVAGQPLKAMILLAINGGFGNTDVSSLPVSAFDFDSGWVDFARVKTGIERRCPLWPETAEAVQDAIANRPHPNDKADSDLAFLTKYGNRWVRMTTHGQPEKRTAMDAIAQEFRKLLDSLDINGKRNFYAIRHTLETIGGESKDQVAVNAIMGHLDNSMAGVYRERISDGRLQAVTDTVRRWIWPISAEPTESE